jgi:hypothetical protein
MSFYGKETLLNALLYFNVLCLFILFYFILTSLSVTHKV